MKKYRLKQWYPSLDVTLSVGDIIELTGACELLCGSIKYEFLHKTGDYCDVGFIQECEFNNPDFWELIEEKKPLFITEDGVEIFEGDEYIAIGINYDFSKVDTVAHDQVYSGDVMRFKYESNADEYILWNKPLLSLNEIDDTIEMYTHEFEELIKLAKEAVKKQ